jgi:MFS family permease
MLRPADNPRGLSAFAPTLILLVVCLVINYIDRGNLSVAAPLLSVELHLTSSQLGALFAAFFITYTAMQFVVGWLVDHFEVNWILITGFSLWSVATATTGLVRGFVILFGIRLILGTGESVALPASSKILAQHLPEHQRGFASGALMSALRFGSAVGTFGTGFLMAKFGWRPIFIGVGLVSLLWLPAWIRWMPEKTFASTQSLDVGFAALLRQRSFWGTCAGHFSCNYLFYFMITWLPTYLVSERHLSMLTMTWVAGLYYSVDALSAIASGWLQDHWIRRGNTTTLVRKSAMALGLSMAAVAITGCSVAPQAAYLPWLLAAGVGCGMTGPGLFTFPQTLAGARVVGRWYGWQNGIANLAGIVGPALTGFIVQWTGNFRAPFWITASLCIAGGFSWVFVVERVEQVSWSPIGDVLLQPNLDHSETRTF